MTAKRRPPWKRANPKKKAGTSRKLTPSQKAEAKASARRAGRPYPNLVDNMRVAARSRAKKKAVAAKGRLRQRHKKTTTRAAR